MKKRYPLNENSLVCRSVILTSASARRIHERILHSSSWIDSHGAPESGVIVSEFPCSFENATLLPEDFQLLRPELSGGEDELRWSALRSRLVHSGNIEDLTRFSVEFHSARPVIDGRIQDYCFATRMAPVGSGRNRYRVDVSLSAEPSWISDGDEGGNLVMNPTGLGGYCQALRYFLDFVGLTSHIDFPDEYGTEYPCRFHWKGGDIPGGTAPSFLFYTFREEIISNLPAGALEIEGRFSMEMIALEAAMEVLSMANSILIEDPDPSPENFSFNPETSRISEFRDWAGIQWGSPWVQERIFIANRTPTSDYLNQAQTDWSLFPVGCMKICSKRVILDIIKVPGGWRFHATASGAVSRKRVSEIRAELAAIAGMPEDELWEPMGPRGGWLGVPQW